MKTADYIEALKPLAKKPSIYAVAQLLDMPEETVRAYSKGRRYLDPMAATKVAELLDVPAMQVIADAELESATDEKRREFWRDLARKLHGATAIAVFAIAGVHSNDTAASQVAQRWRSAAFDISPVIATGEYKLYAKRISRIIDKSIDYARMLIKHFLPIGNITALSTTQPAGI